MVVRNSKILTPQSFASPKITSILKLNDSLHGSSHSSSSFSVRDASKALHLDSSFSSPLPPFIDEVASPETSTSGEDPTIIIPKSVSFSDQVETHEIVHHQDMEETEKDDRWYRKKEWKSLRREGRVTTRLLQNGELTNNHEELGLETFRTCRLRIESTSLGEGCAMDN